MLPCCEHAPQCDHAARAWRPQRSRPMGRKRGAAGSPSAGFEASYPRGPPVDNGGGVGAAREAATEPTEPRGRRGREARAERKAASALDPEGCRALAEPHQAASGCTWPASAAAGTTRATMPGHHPRRVASTDHLGHLGQAHGVCTVYAWCMRDTCTVCVWCVHGVCKVCARA